MLSFFPLWKPSGKQPVITAVGFTNRPAQKNKQTNKQKPYDTESDLKLVSLQVAALKAGEQL